MTMSKKVEEKKQKSYEKQNQFLEVLKRLVKNKTAVAGFIIFIILALASICAPLLTPYSYSTPSPAEALQGPSAAHIFGTDNLGRDLFTRILYGGRVSLGLSLLAVAFSTICGVVIGAICGYFGKGLDNVVMRLLDIIQAIPAMLLTIIIATSLGTGLDKTVLALGIGPIPLMARLTRSSVMKASSFEYVEAAEAIGCSQFRRIFMHVLPNSLAPMIVEASMGVASTILSLSSLSYIGLGVQPPTPEWGALLSGAKLYMRSHPYLIIFPGVFIALTVLALNLAGDGLRDALDPRLRQ